VSSLFFLTPAVTAVLAFIFLGQGLGLATLAGLVVSGAGVTLATGRPQPPAAPAAGVRPKTAPPNRIKVGAPD
jgi:drug/metabolite transporter (DMT)-like permease